MLDFIDGFRRDVVNNLLLRVGVVIPIGWMRAERMWALMGAPSLIGLARMSLTWHGLYQDICAAQLPQRDVAQAMRADVDMTRWPALFHGIDVPGTTLTVRCITDATELEAHGREMRHCVGGYAGNCLTARSHIVVLERLATPDVDTSLATPDISTAELTVSGVAGEQETVVTRQHYGPLNATPGEQATRALLWVTRQLNASLRGEACQLPCNDLGAIAEQGRTRRELLDAGRAHARPQYGLDAVVMARVLQAYRFALPKRMRAAMDAQEGDAERCDAAARWLVRTYDKECLQIEPARTARLARQAPQDERLALVA